MQEEDDPYLRLVLGALEGIEQGASHGHFWVDYLPILKHVPAWFPGASFKRKAKEWKSSVMKLRDEPWGWVQRAIVSQFTTLQNSQIQTLLTLLTQEEGTADPSFCTQMMERFSIESSEDSVMENVIKNCATSTFAAGADTTATALISFILAMVRHPEFQVQAQKEIDTVVGHGRLPDFDDREKLPFVNALIAETLRWNPVTPLGVAHRASGDDEYKGYRIPAGATIIANAW
ncbi:hypothetical protein PQX77_012962 [Marasmius sp. AFHP31]|nr:hypothetical protein PQX77_012962 [Marasmius sp. AFHP31]